MFDFICHDYRIRLWIYAESDSEDEAGPVIDTKALVPKKHLLDAIKESPG